MKPYLRRTNLTSQPKIMETWPVKGIEFMPSPEIIELTYEQQPQEVRPCHSAISFRHGRRSVPGERATRAGACTAASIISTAISGGKRGQRR
jgi:hypothetical protein